MPATNLTALKNAQRSLLLKPLDAAVFLAPWYTAAPTAFTDASGALQTLPAAFKPVGLIDKKTGVAFARGITAAPIEAYGELQPVRNDITSDITTIEFQPQQTTALTLELTTSANLAQVKSNATSGEVFFPQPASEQITYYSAIIIGKDGNDAEPIYVFKVLPKVAVSKFGGEQWNPTEVLAQKLTMVAFKDDTAGYAVAHGFGGLGWKKIVAQTGIAPAA
ncbi:phage tail tube protein [Nocardia xishanensis]